MSKHYGNDLAYIHDVGFGHFARNAAPGVLGILRAHGIESGRIVDLGCGTGLWARELDHAGYNVFGIDISASMIAMARKRVPQATFRRTSMLSARLPACDAVTALGEVFNYLFDDRVSEDTLAALFERIHAALRPEGLLIFDVAEPGRERARGQRLRHWEARDWAMLIRVDEDTGRRELTRTMTTFRRVGRLYRRDHEVHRLRLYKASEIAVRLRHAGFVVRTVRHYGKMPLPQGMVGFVARKWKGIPFGGKNAPLSTCRS
jgi:SAM-dependent methyltransferase